MNAPPLTAERLRELLHYEPATGCFVWRVKHHWASEAGASAGVRDNGYVVIRLDRRAYRAHRLAWLYMTSEWPASILDHKNLVKDDNRWTNLRPATPQLNAVNCKLRKDSETGLKGVSRHRSHWRARIRIDGKRTHLGNFPTPAAAHAAYMAKARELFGEFARAE